MIFTIQHAFSNKHVPVSTVRTVEKNSTCYTALIAFLRNVTATPADSALRKMQGSLNFERRRSMNWCSFRGTEIAQQSTLPRFKGRSSIFTYWIASLGDPFALEHGVQIWRCFSSPRTFLNRPEWKFYATPRRVLGFDLRWIIFAHTWTSHGAAVERSANFSATVNALKNECYVTTTKKRKGKRDCPHAFSSRSKRPRRFPRFMEPLSNSHWQNSTLKKSLSRLIGSRYPRAEYFLSLQRALLRLSNPLVNQTKREVCRKRGGRKNLRQACYNSTRVSTDS